MSEANCVHETGRGKKFPLLSYLVAQKIAQAQHTIMGGHDSSNQHVILDTYVLGMMKRFKRCGAYAGTRLGSMIRCFQIHGRKVRGWAA